MQLSDEAGGMKFQSIISAIATRATSAPTTTSAPVVSSTPVAVSAPVVSSTPVAVNTPIASSGGGSSIGYQETPPVMLPGYSSLAPTYSGGQRTSAASAQTPSWLVPAVIGGGVLLLAVVLLLSRRS